ncbi:hypothetical protein RJ639_002221 [Escallonia herrerae]|uniref:Uncharacterized protein n=1 Tax=Escallonia herrerae TaxID=1293975 RepID=A0AA89BGK1_9ASTE|nr:hypothetical protein RJ639_002221 [Escallonia herrerae]
MGSELPNGSFCAYSPGEVHFCTSTAAAAVIYEVFVEASALHIPSRTVVVIALCFVLCYIHPDSDPLLHFGLLSQVDAGIACVPCNGKGWLLCDFCKGQKTNVKAENNRIYRRCPSCRAVGYILCSKCKVFKCVTFPNYSDGEDLTL